MGERLFLQLFYLLRREGVALAGESPQRTDPFTDNEVILLHKGIPFGKQGDDIFIKLYAEQYDYHAEEVGKKETDKLADTDMLAEKLPDECHNGVVLQA